MKLRFNAWVFIVIVLTAAVVVPLGAMSTANGCGLDWAMPRNHFEGVTNQGYVSYWEKIGEINCGDGLVLPLHINFNSRRDDGAPSPYLGQGWLLALLESRFVQEGEDRFNMIQPDGVNNLFLRAERGGDVLNGSAGWKGEIKGNIINAWASCGWKLVFTNGRITSMTTDKGRRLDWVYEGGRVSELRESGATRLQVEYGANGLMQALALPTGERILVAQDKKPRVQTVAGQNVVAGVDNSLSRLVLADGREQSFSFGTDEQKRPTMKVGGAEPRKPTSSVGEAAGNWVMSWNPQNKLIIRDGAWVYQITPAKGMGENAAIGRMNEQGGKEYWFIDGAKGEETTVKVDGTKIVRTWFLGGTVAGKTRKIEEMRDGFAQEVRRTMFSYDSAGNMRRCLLPDGTTLFFAVGN